MLINDINFADPGNQVVVAKTNQNTGLPTEYAVRAYGEVVSGIFETRSYNIGEFERFKRIDLQAPNLTEIVSVVDSEGNEYYEVDYLSQNIVYRSVPNYGANAETVPNLLKPFVAMRRFVVERERGRNFIQFGHGSEENIAKQGFLRPDDLVLKRHARDHITDLTFDPSKLIQSDKFGVSPSNTVLTVNYRTNNSLTVNAGVGAISSVSSKFFKFRNPEKLTSATKSNIVGSLEVSNEEPIVGDVSYPSIEEVKRRVFDTFSSQHRAVTAEDYKALIYMMPTKFGSIKDVAFYKIQMHLKET